jgi:tetratricopeptide (TPR) repeat protein
MTTTAVTGKAAKAEPGLFGKLFAYVTGGTLMCLSFCTMVLGWFSGLTFVLVILKLCHVINWSWLMVFAPTWIPFGLNCLAVLLCLVAMSIISVFDIGRKPHWYESAWMLLPSLLDLTFGLYGCGLGAAATYANSRVFRTALPTFVKYVATSGITSSALIIWIAIVFIETSPGSAHADMCELMHDKKGAIVGYTQAIKEKHQAPSYWLAGVYRNRGACRLELGDKQGAIDDFNNSIKLEPSFAGATQGLRAVAHEQLGDHQAAIADCTEAIRLQPNDSLPYYWRSKAHAKLGHVQEAKNDLDQWKILHKD